MGCGASAAAARSARRGRGARRLLRLRADVDVVRREPGRVGDAAAALRVEDGRRLLREEGDVAAVEVDAVEREPLLVDALEDVVLAVEALREVDEAQGAAVDDQGEHVFHGRPPVRDHREAVGARDRARVAPLQPELREVREGLRDVAAHAVDAVAQAQRLDALLRHGQEVRRQVAERDARGFRQRLEVLRDELDVARGAAADADEGVGGLRRFREELGHGGPGHGVLEERVAAREQRLAEAVVGLALRAVEGGDVLLLLQRLLGHGVAHEQIVLEAVGVDRPRARGDERVEVEVLGDGRAPLAQVPADAVVGLDLGVGQLGQGRRVHREEVRLPLLERRARRVGPPEDAARAAVHALEHVADEGRAELRRHPVHGVEQAHEGEAPGPRGRLRVAPGPVEQRHAPPQLGLVHGQEPRVKVGGHVARALGELVELAAAVAVVEVVVAAPHALPQDLVDPVREDARPPLDEGELLRRDAAQRRRPGPDDGRRQQPDAQAQHGGRRGRLLRAEVPLEAAREAQGPRHEHEQVGHDAARAREHPVVAEELVQIPVPVRAARVAAEQLPEPRPVVLREHARVAAAPEREEVGLGHLGRDAGELEVEHGELGLVQVHGGDMPRLLEQVVQHVAARGRDRQHDVVGR
mmetsp:Transcript_15481/g.50382  ORF Transcript_15481/g.50382 Transcript_15481/m.50382 type:complete len:640 (+) Transcript_15481:105-2024(+)